MCYFVLLCDWLKLFIKTCLSFQMNSFLNVQMSLLALLERLMIITGCVEDWVTRRNHLIEVGS